MHDLLSNIGLKYVPDFSNSIMDTERVIEALEMKEPLEKETLHISLSQQESEMTTIDLIQKLANDNGFTLRDIQQVAVRATPLEKNTTPPTTAVPSLIRNVYDAPAIHKGSTVETTENQVDVWKNDKNNKLYAKIPMQYEITLGTGDQQKRLLFSQPLFTNVEIRNNFTPNEKTRAEKQLMAIALGVRETIRTPLLCNDKKAIQNINKKNLFFEFAYGEKNQLNGKKISLFLKELSTKNQEQEVIGIYPIKSTKVHSLFSTYIPLDFKPKTYSFDEKIGKTHIGYMRLPYLNEIENERNSYRRICKEILSTNDETKKQELESILEKKKAKIGDINAIMQLEIQSAIEKMDGIHQFFNGDEKVVKELQEEEAAIKKKIGNTAGLLQQKKVQFAKYGLPTDLSQYWLTDFTIPKKLDLMHLKIWDDLKNVEKMKEKEKIQKGWNEEKIQQLKEEVLFLGDLKSIFRECKELQAKMILHLDTAKESATKWLLETLAQIEEHETTIQVLEKKSISFSDTTMKQLSEFKTSLKQYNYEEMRSLIEKEVQSIKIIKSNITEFQAQINLINQRINQTHS